MLAIVELGHSGQLGDGRKHIEQVVSIRIGGAGAEVERLPIRGAHVSFAGTGDQRHVDQTVVLGESNEDTTKQPCDRGLAQHAAAPRIECLTNPFGLSRGLVFGLERESHLRVALGLLGEIHFEPPQLPAESTQQGLAVDHERAAPLSS